MSLPVRIPFFPYHFAYMFLFPIPTLPRIFAKVLPSTAPFLAGHPTRPRRQRLARAPRTEEGPSRAERLRPRPKQDPWKFLAFRASVRFAVAANIYKHMICLAQQKQKMKKLPHVQTHIHQNSCKNFKSCSLQNQFGAGMLHSFVRQLSSSYMQGWICGQRGERQQD